MVRIGRGIAFQAPILFQSNFLARATEEEAYNRHRTIAIRNAVPAVGTCIG